MSTQVPSANFTPGLGWLFFSPIGRVSRQAYWLGVLVIWSVIGIAVNMWLKTLEPNGQIDLLAFVDSNPLFPILLFVLQWIELALVIKRCQDAGLPGLLAALILIPIVNMVAFLVIGVLPAQNAPNSYGPCSNSYYRRKS